MREAKRRSYDPEAARAADARERARRSIEALDRLPETHAARARVLARTLDDVAAALEHVDALADERREDTSRFTGFIDRVTASAIDARSPILVRRGHLERCVLGVAERCGIRPSEEDVTSAVDYTVVRMTAEDADFGNAVSEARTELRAMILAATARRPRHAQLSLDARSSGNARPLVTRYLAARAALFRAVHLR